MLSNRQARLSVGVDVFINDAQAVNKIKSLEKERTYGATGINRYQKQYGDAKGNLTSEQFDALRYGQSIRRESVNDRLAQKKEAIKNQLASSISSINEDREKRLIALGTRSRNLLNYVEENRQAARYKFVNEQKNKIDKTVSTVDKNGKKIYKKYSYDDFADDLAAFDKETKQHKQYVLRKQKEEERAIEKSSRKRILAEQEKARLLEKEAKELANRQKGASRLLQEDLRLAQRNQRIEGKFLGDFRDFTKNKTKKEQARFLSRYLDSEGNLDDQAIAADGRKKHHIAAMLDAHRRGLYQNPNDRNSTLGNRIGAIFLGRAIGQEIVNYASKMNQGYVGRYTGVLSTIGSTTNGIGAVEGLMKAESLRKQMHRSAGIGAVGAGAGAILGGAIGAFGGVPGVLAGAALGTTFGGQIAEPIVGAYAQITNQPELDPRIQKEKMDRLAEQYTKHETAKNSYLRSKNKLIRSGASQVSGTMGAFSLGLDGEQLNNELYNFRKYKFRKGDLQTMLGITQGYGVDAATLSGGLNTRFSDLDMNMMKKVLGNAVGFGMPISKFDEVISRQAGITNFLGQTRREVVQKEALGFNNYFSSMGGMFGMNDPRAMDNITKVTGNMSNPKSEFGQAFGFMAALKTAGKGASITQILETQQKGGVGYQRNLAGMMQSMGMGELGLLGFATEFTDGNIALAKDYYNNFQGASTKSRGGALNVNSALKRAKNLTTKVDAIGAQITGTDIQDPVKGWELKQKVVAEMSTEMQNFASAARNIKEASEILLSALKADKKAVTTRTISSNMPINLTK